MMALYFVVLTLANASMAWLNFRAGNVRTGAFCAFVTGVMFRALLPIIWGGE